jgi:hypothetical protein
MSSELMNDRKADDSAAGAVTRGWEAVQKLTHLKRPRR